MIRSTMWCVRAACTLVLVAILMANVWAVPASSNFSEPSVQTSHDMQSLQGGGLGWEIGSANNRTVVTLDPTAGPWIKNLFGPNGGNVNADDTGFTASSSYQLNEHFVIGGPLSWTDFHEVVLTPGWDIGALISANGAPVPGLQVDITYTNGSTRLGSMSMTFDPLAPGTQIDLTKQLIWVGDPNVQGNLFSGVVQVAEYPTPEPASAALFGMGVIGLFLLRRRLAH